MNRPNQTFAGFAAGKMGTILVPEPFFSDLLPLIDDLAELKLTIYAFWALQQREGEYRYMRLRDLRADRALLAGLGENPESALENALERASERGTLLSIDLPDGERLFFLNTDKGRKAIEAMTRGDWQPGAGDHPVALIANRPNIFALYEENVGPLTPLIAETLRDAEKTYAYDWIIEAIQIALESNKRSWRYIEAILKRWMNEGKVDKPPASNGAQDSDSDANRYLRDSYFQRRKTRDDRE